MRIAFIDLNNGKRFGETNIGLLELISFLSQRRNDKIEFFDEVDLAINHWRRFDLMVFSSMGFPLEKFINSKKAKILSHIPITKIAGGPGPTIIPEKGLIFADIVIRGEGEIPLLKIINLTDKIKLKREILKSTELKGIENLVFKFNNEVYKTNRVYYPELKPSKIDWNIVKNLEQYIKRWPYLDYIKGTRGISFVSSRSCPFNCSFCQPTVREIFGNRMKFKDSDAILEELLFLRKNYKINSFMLHDDTFTINKNRVIEFCDKLISLREKGISFNWICNSRVDTIDEEMAFKMSKAGCKEVRFGVETIDEEKRNSVLNKGIKDKDIERSIKITKRNKMRAFGFFMLGLPEQNFRDALKEIRRISSSNLDLATFSILTPMPGTYLGDKYNVNSFNNYYKSNRNNISKMSNLSLELTRIFAIISFYFRPKRFKNTFKQLSSMHTLFYKLRRFIGSI